MRKKNAGDVSASDQTRAAAAKARRARRKAKLADQVTAKLRPLLLKLGQLEAELRLLRATKSQQSPAGGE